MKRSFSGSSSLAVKNKVENERNILVQAISLIEAGKTDEGGKLLASLLKQQPKNELAWQWLHVCVKTKEQKIFCLTRALEINPNRLEVRKALEELTESSAIASKPVALNSTDISNQAKKIENTTDITDEVISKPPVVNTFLPGKAKDKSKSIDKKYAYYKKKARKRLSDRKGRGKKTTRGTKEIIIPSWPPTVFIVKPEDNIFANENWKQNRLPPFDIGMYGNTLFVDGIRINNFHLPRCLKIGQLLEEENCDLCTFFSAQECFLKNQPGLLDEVRIFFEDKRQKYLTYVKRRKAIIRTIYSELKAHGRPLHYSTLARIMAGRHSYFKMTEQGILRTMAQHPMLFEKVDKGVYQCRRKNLSPRITSKQ